jgi:hypothetical protein
VAHPLRRLFGDFGAFFPEATGHGSMYRFSPPKTLAFDHRMVHDWSRRSKVTG